MSSDNEHIALANRYQTSLDQLLMNVPDFGEMIAIAAYYKAVHVVEAVFYRDPAVKHCHTHGERLEIIGRHNYRRYGALYKPLKNLWGASEVARYLVLRDETAKPRHKSFSHFSEYLPPSSLRTDLLDRNLVPFEKTATDLLGPLGSTLQLYTPGVAPSTTVATHPPPPGSTLPQ